VECPVSFLTADDKDNPWDDESMPSLVEITAMYEALVFAKAEIARYKRMEDAVKHLILEFEGFRAFIEGDQK
jgi:hypothetical protein